MRRWLIRLATCGGLGFTPLAPGTVGAAAGLIPVLLLEGWAHMYAAVLVVLFFAGVRASAIAEEHFGKRDSPRIVIDEAVSTMVTFAAQPLTLPVVIAGFSLNRFFDIVKPFPAGRVERLGNGWGVMMDDIVAGVYSNVLLRLIWHLWLRGS